MDQIRFENELYLFGLLLIPVLLILFMWMQYRRNKAFKAWGHEDTVRQLMPELPKYKRTVKIVLLGLAAAFISLGMANLQYGSKEKEVERKGLDVMIVLDLSKSMLAEDVEPNRLDKAKLFIRELLKEFTNDRVGLIIFAGNAYVQMPLTVDYAAANIFLNSISTDMVPTQGTAIGDAIELSEKAFNKKQEKYKTLLIISDGENHQEGTVKLAEKAQAEGVVINTVGVGSEDGAPIPVKRNGRQMDYVRNQAGDIVVSKMNPDILKEIAGKGGGEFFRLRDSRETVQSVTSAIEVMEKRKMDTKIYTDYTDHFQYFLGGALLLLILEFLITERKSRLFEKIGF